MSHQADYITKAGKNLADYRQVYFIGIGGIGMSALARFFKSKGAAVAGYDRHPTTLTDQLAAEGILIHFTEDTSQIPAGTDLVIYTPAIPKDSLELAYVRTHFTGIEIVKRSDVLGWITQQSFNICVGGSHGKTSISTMTAHILRHSGYGCNAFLGGIAVNYDSNFWSSDRQVSVIEADEYDRSFLKLSADIAVITAMDADHLDIYGTPREVENAYIAFSEKIKPGGLLISKYGLTRDSELKADRHLHYSRFNEQADLYASNLQVQNGSYVFDVHHKQQLIPGLTLTIGGLHNVENMVAAVGVALELGIAADKIKAAVADFKGVKRRFEYHLRDDQHILIDDYAHHPEELAALIEGVRSLYAKKLTVVFQPHLYSRTKDLATAFAEALDKADEVILLPIYPARELPMEGVSSLLILNNMQLEQKRILEKQALLSTIQKENPELLVLCGAGDIAELIEPVKAILSPGKHTS
ncbi:UDP-N-acetylmuramate--L-alanine ligase [Arachidicoccus rhizosphaerae]|uniref:UDP-N-acetylmuramate--L-alanine ligase n=1 Tax=Arachidicoccus rhizosphaerae TaxID=551991 RepID=A0A1H3Y034_9BACT|nr:UDP-N-acetylmuramate--L-alanine ligase [Arachidicoccus rhizosphaerae]SEA04933.1 UDP-N-acetylmuramate--L-alanine ligase [Arachidicoccus rhizosphaerae]